MSGLDDAYWWGIIFILLAFLSAITFVAAGDIVSFAFVFLSCWLAVGFFAHWERERRGMLENDP